MCVHADDHHTCGEHTCKVVTLHRSTQRLAPPPVTDEEAELREFLRQFAKQRPRWGWRRAAKEARRQGRQVNGKRVRRLWRDEGLRVPQKRRKKRLSGVGAHVGAMCPIRPNVLWAMDFQFDTLANGRTIKMLNVIDEFTRECLTIEVTTWDSAPLEVRNRVALCRCGASGNKPLCGGSHNNIGFPDGQDRSA